MCRRSLFLFLLLTPLIAFSQARSSKLKPLYFQADKNKVQVLPQRFEYTFLDENRLKIGDILLDTTKITFQVEPSPSQKGTYRIQFSWPADLIKEGQLTLKNNYGKAIFSTPVTKSNITLSTGKVEGDAEGLRYEVATLTVEEAPPDLVEDMKYLPFMEFCLYKESEETRLYLCSKELYLSSQSGPLTVKARNSSRKSSQIEINGKIVGNQGIIYLNDRSENVAFKAQIRTGAFLEIETRMKEVDFKDVIVSNDNENIILTASGARPVNESAVKIISDTEWQVSLPRNRPVLYLLGDGDIPMRQEFYVRGQLPRERNRAFLSARSLSRTYSSRLILNGIAPEELTVRALPDQDNSKIEIVKKNQFQWTIENLPKGKESRHYLTLSTGENEFVAGYDIFRGQPFGLGLSAKHFNPAGITYGNIDFQWWIENFLLQSSPWAHFHWGLSLEREQQITENNEFAKVHFTTAALLWRAQDGYPLVDETWGLTLPLQNIEGDNFNTLAYGVGAFVEKKPGRWFKNFMHWSELSLEYLAGSSGGEIQLNSALRLRGRGFWALSPQWHLRYGLEVRQIKFTPAAPKEELQVGLDAGMYWKF